MSDLEYSLSPEVFERIKATFAEHPHLSPFDLAGAVTIGVFDRVDGAAADVLRNHPELAEHMRARIAVTRNLAIGSLHAIAELHGLPQAAHSDAEEVKP